MKLSSERKMMMNKMDIEVKNKSGSIDDLVKVYNDGYFYRYLISNNRNFSVMELVSKITNLVEAERGMVSYKMNIELKNGLESIGNLFDIYDDGYLCVYLIYRINTAKPLNGIRKLLNAKIVHIAKKN